MNVTFNWFIKGVLLLLFLKMNALRYGRTTTYSFFNIIPGILVDTFCHHLSYEEAYLNYHTSIGVALIGVRSKFLYVSISCLQHSVKFLYSR